MRRAAPWALALGLAGCIDVPALSFHTPLDSGADDAAGSDAAARQDAQPGAPDARAIPADARGSTPDLAVAGDAAPPAADAVKLPPDAPLAVDARALEPDASVGPRPDAFAPPPGFDAFVPPPDFDAFVPPPAPDAFVPPPAPDAFVPPPVPDMAPPPLPDMAPPPLPDMAPPPVPDMAPPPAPDAAVPPPGIVVVPRNVPGVVAGRRFGAALAIVPDQNGDGFLDVVVGSPRTNNGAAASGVFLIDGVTGVEISHYLERNEPDDFGASLVAGPFASGAPGWQVIVGAGTSNNGRGMIFAHELPGLGQIDTVAGQDQNGRFGSALAFAHDGPLLLALTAVPGIVFSPRALYYRLRFDAPGVWNLDRHVRINASVVAGGNFGSNVLGLPPAQAGDVDDFVAVADTVIPVFRRVLRFRNGSPAPLRGEYVPSDPDMTTGTSLLEIPFAPSMLAVGTPGRGNGLVSVFVREAGMAEDPILEMTPLEHASQFGASLALAPLLTTAEVAFPVVCVGAPGAAPAVPGEVECRGVGAESNLLTLTAPAGASGFGRTLAVATARDPDGTWLIVVGAPDTTGPNGALGGIVLHRVTSPP